MGTWSGEPFGNDSASDWAYELAEATDWEPVREALDDALSDEDFVADDVATIAIAAAEVVAHGLGRGTEDDAYTEAVTGFVTRVGEPPADLVELAVRAVAAATGPASGLTELWMDGDPGEWQAATAEITAALRG